MNATRAQDSMAVTSFRRLRRSAAGACLAALCLVAPASGKVVFEEPSDGRSPGTLHGRGAFVRTPDGRPAYTVGPLEGSQYGGLTYPPSVLSGLSGGRGTLEFSLQVLRPRAVGRGMEPVLELVDGGGRNLLTLYFEPVRGFMGGPELFVDWRNDAWPTYDVNVWGEVIPLGFAPKLGEWVHLGLTFGPRPGDNAVYVNGTPARTFYDGKELTARNGRLDLSGVAGVRVGAEGRWWTEGTSSASYLEATAVAGLRFHDEVVRPPAIADVSHPGDVEGLTGAFVDGATELRWQAVPAAAGYAVYRRSGASVRYERLAVTPAAVTFYRDAAVLPGQTYRYSVAAVDADGVESRDAAEVGVTASAAAVASVAAEKPAYGGGREVVVSLRGTADAAASFTLEGVTPSPVAMAEVDDGVYVGKVAVPGGMNLTAAKLTGTLVLGGETASAQGAPVAIDSVPPEPVGNILALALWAGEIEVAWDPSPSADLDHYAVYRGAGADPAASGEPLATVREPKLLDTSVIPGLAYRYAVVPVDRAGNAGPVSAVASVKAVGGDGLSSVAAEPAGQTLRPGAVLTLTAVGRSGGQAEAAVGTLPGRVALAEQGRTGRYVGTYTVRAEDVAATKSLHRVVARLTDAAGELASLAGAEVAIVGQDGLNDITPPALSSVGHDGWKAAGLSGKLVAGDVVTVTLGGEPGGRGSFAVAGVAKAVPLAETASGVYTGSWTVPWGAAGTDLPVVATLADDNGNEATLRAEQGLTFDTRLRLAVAADKALLPADRKSGARLTAKAENANGKAIEGHELVLTLATTEEYTGVVGGGSVGGKAASMDDADDLEVKWGGVTNHFGEVSADYTAGFAAKTALVIAKDLTTGDVGAGWLNTYVASTVAIELLPRSAKGAEDKALLRMAADPAKLTADGRSTSRIKVWLTNPSGTPLAGAAVAFSLGNENGRLKVLRGTTDAKGVAEAEYRAGTAIGTVTVTAAAAEYGVTGSVQIILTADAPAKIDLVASAAKLFANGSDTATLSVVVTDVHDNPNAQVPVTFTVLQGSGSVAKPALLTDRNGEGQLTFTAGTKAGPVVVEARHTSRPPTEQELRRVYGTVFVPRWYERQERDRVKVGEWLVTSGQAVEKGETLVTVETRTGTQTLTAPAKGVFVREVKHERDGVELGDTIGYVEIDPDVWKQEYAH